MLLLVIIFGGTFYGQDALQGKIFTELKDIVGSNTALQIQDIIKGLQFQKNSVIATVIGTIALVIGATGIFVEIQDSLNMIWGVRPKAKKGFIKLLLNRVISFSMIIGLGFLLIVSLVVNTILLALSKWLLSKFPELPFNVLTLINTAVIFFVISFLFSVIFKMLPDVRIRWKQVWPGAFDYCRPFSCREIPYRHLYQQYQYGKPVWCGKLHYRAPALDLFFVGHSLFRRPVYPRLY